MYGKASDFMHEPTFLTRASTVKEAADIMAEKNIGSVLIGSPEGLEGILTERDILKKVVSRGLDPQATIVSDIMTAEIVTVEAEADIHRIASKFTTNSIRRLPVTEAGNVVGILTTRDITRTFIPEFFRDHPSFKEIKEYKKTG